MLDYLHRVRNTFDAHTAGRKFFITAEFYGAITSQAHDHRIGPARESRRFLCP